MKTIPLIHRQIRSHLAGAWILQPWSLRFAKRMNIVQPNVNRVVNISLTLRNWVIGAYIQHYELQGQDRAKYGDSLLDALAKQLTVLKVSNCNRRQLYRYLRFFRLYPAIWRTVSPQLPLLAGLADALSVPVPTGQQKGGTASPQLGAPLDQLIQRLSYSHLELIVDLDDPLKRAFYEIECIRGNWSVRALKAQGSHPGVRDHRAHAPH